MIPSRALSSSLLIALSALVAPGDRDAAASGTATQPALTAPAPLLATPRLPSLPTLTSPRGVARPGVALAGEPGRAPTLLLAPPAAAPPAAHLSLEQAARAQLRALLPAYGADPSALDRAVLRHTHDTGRGGIILVLRQRLAGVDLLHSDLKLLLDRQRRLIAVSGALLPAPAAPPAFTTAPAAALARAFTRLGARLPAGAIVPSREPDRAGWRRYDLDPSRAPDLRLRRPARIQPVYRPDPQSGALVAAHRVELQLYPSPRAELLALELVLADDDGRELERRDLIAHEAFQYRVWADPDGDKRPHDSPLADFTPHPTGVPGDPPGPSGPPALVSIDGFNSLGDPWLPPGALETVGNNVDAYIDHTEPDGLSPEEGEYRAAVTAPGVFDHTYDLGLAPLASPEQSMAATVQLFYDINWLHDWWYDSGFNEPAGTAQLSNYGRGGEEGDRMRAEAQDGALAGNRNNANMMTPSDGESPRMQMYLWSGLVLESSLTLWPPGEAVVANHAQFGPKDYEVKGEVVFLADGEGVDPNDGCEPALGDLSGKIALINRANCTFEVKVTHAEAAGAVGVIIADHTVQDNPPPLGADPDTADPTIPTTSITNASGLALKDALGQGEVNAKLSRLTGAERDGTIDNMIVAHEWGHYIHMRLVDCGNIACRAQSEGWGDFLGLHMALREGDDLDGTYAGTTYANHDPTAYFGIRRVPYSVDFKKNALTLRHISDGEPLPQDHPMKGSGQPNSQVHNAGEIWATSLWEAYIALHKAHAGELSFTEIRRRMSDYIVAGMILAPSMPTYTEQRDALLLAIGQQDPKDHTLIAQAFARRGAGSCAISPPRASIDLVGVVEDYEIRANGRFLAATLDDGKRSCDGDGVLDSGELGQLHLKIVNGGALALAAGATVELLPTSPSLTFPSGTTLELPALAPLEATEVAFDVALAGELAASEIVALRARILAEDGCDQPDEIVLPVVIHGDLIGEAATFDDVEAPASAWTAQGASNAGIWARVPGLTPGYEWSARAIGSPTDTWLTSPPLQVAADKPFIVTLQHAYSFEFEDGKAWDGAVLELTRDDGMTWADVTEYGADPGYTGVIDTNTNALDKRPAFTADSPGYPDLTPLTLDFGQNLAGESVRLRLRLGTDAAVGGPGWRLDDFAFAGITNTPFPYWAPDQCGGGGETTGGDTTGGESTGDPTSTSQGPTATGATGGATTADTDDSATASDTSPQTDEGGCGCRSDAAPRLPLVLLLLPLLRRRRRA